MTGLSLAHNEAASAENPRDVVRAVLGEWLATASRVRRPYQGTTGQPSTISFDVTGTLRGGPNSDGWQKFATDLCEAGIPLFVFTGDAEESLTGGVFDLLRQKQPGTWFIAKPASANVFRPGVHIDDNDSILRSQQIWGTAVMDALKEDASRFLSAWDALTPEERSEALGPWLAFHQSVTAKPAADHNPAPQPGA